VSVQLTYQGEIALLRLCGGVINALSPEMVNETQELLRDVRQNARGLVLAGGEKFFSIGLDLPPLLELDRSAMTDFYDCFSRLLLNVFSLPIPSISAIRGHAVAGGLVLALMTDFRAAGEGRTLLGVNELKLGVTVPYLAELALYSTVSGPAARYLIYEGEYIESAYAKHIGLVDNLFTRDSCEHMAVEKMANIAGSSSLAFAAAKENRIEFLCSKYHENCKRKQKQFVELWFSDEAQILLKEAAVKFKPKNSL
jgi:enoyl-CoA hydratase/carnithine racemase